MKARRIGVTDGHGGLPTISRAVIHGGLVYLCGVTADPAGDVRRQTDQVLQRVDVLLATAGSDRSRLLSAQVWLADMSDFEAHNAAWNRWVDTANPPARACVQAVLWRPGLLVEIAVVAATSMQPRSRLVPGRLRGGQSFLEAVRGCEVTGPSSTPVSASNSSKSTGGEES